MARFIYSLDGESHLIFDLEADQALIGRSSQCALQIPDRRCSRKHAEVRREADLYVLKDLSSKNRVYINEHPIDAEHILQTGDRVLIGDTVLTFTMSAETQQRQLASQESAGADEAGEVKVVQLVDDDDTRWGERKGEAPAGQAHRLETPLEHARGEAIGDPLRRLEILYDVADKIRSILDQNRLLEEIGRILRDFLTPDTLVVMLRDERTGDLRSRIVHTAVSEPSQIRLSRSIVDQCIAEQVSILVADARQDTRFAAADSIVAHRICSAICAPLIHQDEILGVVYADNKSSYMPYRQEELELVTGIINQAATAIANARLHAQLVHRKRLEREMEIAREIQTNILPRQAPKAPHFDIWGASVPAQQVGGDYFDFVVRNDHQLVVAIADVSGKGVASALLSAIMRASLQIFASAPMVDIQELITQLNRAICRDSTDNMFISAVVGILDTRMREFTYANAGHAYPLLYQPDGRRRQLDKGGIFLGLVEDAEYQIDTVPMPAGSLLFLYTDGLTDMINDQEELFGAERMIQILETHRNRSARAICESVFDAARAFRGSADQFDDCTALAIKSLLDDDR